MNIFVQINVKRKKKRRIAKSFELLYEGRDTIRTLVEYLAGTEETYAIDTFMTDNILEISADLLEAEVDRHMYSLEKYDKAFIGDARNGYSIDINIIEEIVEDEYQVYNPYYY